MKIMTMLHADGHGAHSGISHFLEDKLGRAGEFIDEVLLHGLIDTLKLVGFLFLTYLLMEFIEHKASERIKRVMERTGALGPLVGGAIGAVPQCGFSAVASNLYTGRVITLGTLVAVFLSTSDEMIPVLISSGAPVLTILSIVVYKVLVGIVVGFAIDGALRLVGKREPEVDIDRICEEDNCHCERGILFSALHHTLTVSLFILGCTVAVNALYFFVGEETVARIMVDIPFVSHLICSIVGLIPNCAASVVLAGFASSGLITSGAMISGLLTGAGVGLLVLLRLNKRPIENLAIIGILIASGVVFGMIADLIPLLAL